VRGGKQCLIDVAGPFEYIHHDLPYLTESSQTG
jgi:hypothetical protein